MSLSDPPLPLGPAAHAEARHEVAQAKTPECRVVYVDNGPVAWAHTRAMLTSSAVGSTAYINADARDVDTIPQRTDPSLAPVPHRRRGPGSVDRSAAGLFLGGVARKPHPHPGSGAAGGR